jgi:peroxiredoxin (alkyl hydroperoxide reductase subunit C)
MRERNHLMNEPVAEVKVGMQVPDFTINCYDPQEHGFGKVALDELKSQKKWTILFFYPADFTFV